MKTTSQRDNALTKGAGAIFVALLLLAPPNRFTASARDTSSPASKSSGTKDERVSDKTPPRLGDKKPVSSKRETLRGPQRILFTSSRGTTLREPEIYIMNPDGSRQTRLTNNTARDHSPSLSPDRNRIVFVSNRDGGASRRLDIYTMNTDGSNVERLTNEPFLGSEMPSWSHDGERIVFMRSGQIWVMNSDGTGQHQLTEPVAGVLNENPSWSPDGRYIAFTSTRDATPDHPWNWEIYVLDMSTPVITRVPTSRLRRLTFNNVEDKYPRWSPDSRRIAFVSSRDSAEPTRNDEIYVMNADGTDQRRVTNTPSWDWHPTWSPDGRKIAFSRRDAIWTVAPDGSNERRLTNPEQPGFPSDSMPDWK